MLVQHPNGTLDVRRADNLKGVPPFPAECATVEAERPGAHVDTQGTEMMVTVGWTFAIPIENLIDGPGWYTDEFWTTFNCTFSDRLDDILKVQLTAAECPAWWGAMLEDAWQSTAAHMRNFGTEAEIKQAMERRLASQELNRARMFLALAEKRAGVAR
jgi:hypothetical protein